MNCHLGFPILSLRFFPFPYLSYYNLSPAQGFDVVDLPKFIENYGGLIRPVKQSNEEQRVLEICSKSAIAAFNKKNVCASFVFRYFSFYLLV